MSAMDKKVKTLMEVVPRLDESEARRLLEKAGGSVNKASDMALEGGEWTAAAAKKKPVAKKAEEKSAAPAFKKDDKKVPRREFVERKPRTEEVKTEAKKADSKAPATIVVVASKSKVETGVSFADMIKRQKQQPEPVVEAAPEPVVEAAPAPKVEEAPVEVPVPQEAVVEEAVAATPAAAPAAEAPKKEKKEKKEPKAKKVAPALPQKHEAEIDRVVSVNLPSNIVELATNAFTFTSEPGRAPTPPRQVQQQQVHHQQAPHQQNEWNHQVRHPQQQVQRGWNPQENYNRNQHFANDWRQQRQGYDSMGYNNRMGNNQQQYRQDNYVMRTAQPQAQPQANNNFW